MDGWNDNIRVVKMLLYNVTFHVVIYYSPPSRKRIQWNPKNGFLMMYLVSGKFFWWKIFLMLLLIVKVKQGKQKPLKVFIKRDFYAGDCLHKWWKNQEFNRRQWGSPEINKNWKPLWQEGQGGDMLQMEAVCGRLRNSHCLTHWQGEGKYLASPFLHPPVQYLTLDEPSWLGTWNTQFAGTSPRPPLQSCDIEQEKGEKNLKATNTDLVDPSSHTLFLLQ